MQQTTREPGSTQRTVSRVVRGQPATDGAGVQLTRVIAQPALPMLDPFLLLDAFRSDRPDDYIAGFPPHPHRGFETVTYLLAGRMRHKDSAGHEGVIEPGGVQWMTAARGIVHSEMPEQQAGLLEGFQLWVNLPAEHKMDPPAYQEHGADEIPVETRRGWDFSRMQDDIDPVPWLYENVVRPYLSPLQRVLDIGTGGGERFLSLADYFGSGIGIDGKMSPLDQGVDAHRERLPSRRLQQRAVVTDTDQESLVLQFTSHFREQINQPEFAQFRDFHS